MKEFQQRIDEIFKQDVLPVWVPEIDIKIWPSDIIYAALKENFEEETLLIVSFIIRDDKIYIIKVKKLQSEETEKHISTIKEIFQWAKKLIQRK